MAGAVMTLTVEYREIPGFPDYKVGTDGSVWSRKIFVGKWIAANEWHQRKPGTTKFGHKYIKLTNGVASRRDYVHVFVLEAFVGPRPHGMVACHYDGDPANNSASNLRWDTQSSNLLDKRHCGTSCCGIKNHNAKLNDNKILDMISLRRQGKTQSELSSLFGVDQAMVSRILNNKAWLHVTTAE